MSGKEYHDRDSGGRNGAHWTARGKYRLARRYSPIPDQIIDKWARHIVPDLGAAHQVVLTTISRLTFGYERQQDEVSLASLVRLSGLSRERVREILTDLEATGVIYRDSSPGRKPVMGIDLDWHPGAEAMARGRRSRDERVRAKHAEDIDDEDNQHTEVVGSEAESEPGNRSTTVSRLPDHQGRPVNRHNVADDMRERVSTLSDLQHITGPPDPPAPGGETRKRSSDPRSVPEEIDLPSLDDETHPGETPDAALGVERDVNKERGPAHRHQSPPGDNNEARTRERNGREKDDDEVPKPKNNNNLKAKNLNDEDAMRRHRRWSSLPCRVGVPKDAEPSNDALADARRWMDWLGLNDEVEAHSALALVAQHARDHGGARRIEHLDQHMERCATQRRRGKVSNLMSLLAAAFTNALKEPLDDLPNDGRNGHGNDRKRGKKSQDIEEEAARRGVTEEQVLTERHGIMWG